jgi:hypothetical protein
MAGMGFEVSGGGEVGDGMFEVGVFGLVVRKRGDCRGDCRGDSEEVSRSACISCMLLLFDMFVRSDVSDKLCLSWRVLNRK